MLRNLEKNELLLENIVLVQNKRTFAIINCLFSAVLFYTFTVESTIFVIEDLALRHSHAASSEPLYAGFRCDAARTETLQYVTSCVTLLGRFVPSRLFPPPLEAGGGPSFYAWLLTHNG